MNALPSKVITIHYDETHVETVEAIALTDGRDHRTVFLQQFRNPQQCQLKSVWVADGYYNKHEYKNYKTAHKAFERAVGDLVLVGFLPCELSETFLSRFLA